MSEYTVVVRRPGRIEEGISSGVDVYLAFVEAETPREAAHVGQHVMYMADVQDDLEPESEHDYKVAVVLDGHVKPALWGWQL